MLFKVIDKTFPEVFEQKQPHVFMFAKHFSY